VSAPDTDRPPARYGEWPSPVGLEQAAAESGSASWATAVGAETWWCSSDPATATVRLLRCLDASPAEVLAPEWSVRNRLMGYGGRPYLVVPAAAPREDHLLVFTEHRDQRLYRTAVPALAAAAPDGAAGPAVEPQTEPQPLTPSDPAGMQTCYADPVAGPDGTEVWCIREITWAAREPDDDPAPRTRREIVAVPLDGSAVDDAAAVRVVASSHHFLSGARLSPDGRRLAWVGWDHPSMPWDETELMVADLGPGPDGRLVAGVAGRVLGGDGVSVPQAEWAGPDALYAMADPDGWWNLHRVELTAAAAPASARCVAPMRRDCADALWRVGPSWFTVTPGGVVMRHAYGDQQLCRWDADSATLAELTPGWTEFGSAVSVSGDDVVVIAGSPTAGRTVLRMPLAGGPGPVRPVARPADDDADRLARWRAVPQRRTARGPRDRDVHYVYYPPTSPTHVGPDGELPPLLVHVHGGPTGATSAIPDREFDLFCGRGFAVASVDYGGSTGYGREYRDRLRHNWGIVDVEDSVAVAAELAAAGLADPARTAVRGGSAGGWTALACLAFSDVFCAGAVYFPISDPLLWRGGHTHDFESRYVESLVGVLPRDRDRYDAVSPIANAHRISSPLVMLQGADDFICPPEQAQCIVDAVAARGLWHRYVVFPGEGHGFRKESSVRDSLLAEAELYSHTMGITVDLAATPA
jgi:dipeptidyl aminopeptidase/acylaminoacyl peptidase